MARIESQKHDNIVEKLINIKRHSKTVKGGRIMRFSALVVVGNGKGKVGIGKGKSREVPIAIQKAIEKAKLSMITVEMEKDTLWYPIIGKHGASKVFMKPASPGTGVIAGKTMRAIFEALGIKDVLAKNYGSTNPINVTKATLQGLNSLQSPTDIYNKRNRFPRKYK